jgi:hypothetical protein
MVQRNKDEQKQNPVNAATAYFTADFDAVHSNKLLNEHTYEQALLNKQTELIETDDTIENNESSATDSDGSHTNIVKFTNNSGIKLTAKQLHYMYGHINLSRSALDALGCSDVVFNSSKECSTCQRIRLRKAKTGSGTYECRHPGPLLQLDIDTQGPTTDIDEDGSIVRVRSVGGSLYILNIVCHYSRFTFTIPMKSKSEAPQHIMNIINLIKNQYNINVQCIFSDNAKEFMTNELKSFYASRGIIQSFSNAYSPSTNGTVERMNQSIMLIIKSLLHTCNGPAQLWAEAAVQAAVIFNNTPLKVLGYVAPITLVTGKAATIPSTVFGSDCIYKLDDHRVGKLTVAGVSGAIIGKATNGIGYRIFTGNSIITTRNVTVHNNKFIYMSELTSSGSEQYYDDFVHEENIEPLNVSNDYEFGNEIHVINTDDEIQIINDTVSGVFPYSSDPIRPSSYTADTYSQQQPSHEINDTTINSQQDYSATDQQISFSERNNVTSRDVDDEYTTGNDKSDAGDSEYESKYSVDDDLEYQNENNVSNSTENYTGNDPTNTADNVYLSPIEEEYFSDTNNAFDALRELDPNENDADNINDYEHDPSTHLPIAPLEPLVYEDLLPELPSNATITRHGRISVPPERYGRVLVATDQENNVTVNTDTNSTTLINAGTEISATNSGATTSKRSKSTKVSSTVNKTTSISGTTNGIGKTKTSTSKPSDVTVNPFPLPTVGGTSSDDEDFGLNTAIVEQDEPTTYAQAMRSRNHKHWTRSMKEEFQSIIKNQVLIKWRRASNTRLLGTKWVYKIKKNELNEPVRFKSRLVVKGYEQQENVDYHETFAPVAHFDTLRLLLALSTIHDNEIYQIDFKTAFLNAGLDEDLFISVPRGMEDEEMDPRQHCFKLNRALYGLKQSPRQWYILLTKELTALGYQPTSSDPCLFYKYVPGSNIPILVGIYVDDVIISVHKSVEHVWFEDKRQILSKYDLDDIGPISFCLKMKIERDREKGTLTISQAAMIHALLEEHGMTDIRIATNPSLSANITDPDIGDDTLLDAEHVTKYQSIIGSLMYISNTTRVDICFTTHQLARYAHAPAVKHMKAAKHVLKYLAGTPEVCLRYTKNGCTTAVTTGPSTSKYYCTATSNTDTDNIHGINVHSYTDSDWAGDQTTRVSTQGNLVLVNGNIVSWSCKKQKSISQSSTEAEFVAINLASRQVVFFQTLLNEIYNIHLTSTILTDNQAAQVWCISDKVSHQKSKHIDIAYKYIRELVNTGAILIQYVPTDRNLSDILTKGLPQVTFSNLCKQIMSTGLSSN